MEESPVIQGITQVFGLSKEDAIDFLDYMSTNPSKPPPPGYFRELLGKLPTPQITEGTNASSLGVNDISISDKNLGSGKGESGSVKVNHARPEYIYKFLESRIYFGNADRDEISIRSKLLEPLINLIVQSDPVASPSICKVYRVFVKRYEKASRLIFRLERLGPTIDSKRMFLTADAYEPEKRKEFLLKIFAPIYKTIDYLRKTYHFEHGDLHWNNIAFVKDPIRSDGTVDESLLTAKIIDFGGSGLVYQGKVYGYHVPDEEFPDILSSRQSVNGFRTAVRTERLPPDFAEAIKSFGKDFPKMEAFLIQEAEKLKGGKRKKSSRKTRRRRSLRKH